MKFTWDGSKRVCSEWFLWSAIKEQRASQKKMWIGQHRKSSVVHKKARRARLGIAPIHEKHTDFRLGWYGHITKLQIWFPPENKHWGVRPRVTSKLRCRDAIEQEMANMKLRAEHVDKWCLHRVPLFSRKWKMKKNNNKANCGNKTFP